jgi:hypothetical protein
MLLSIATTGIITTDAKPNSLNVEGPGCVPGLFARAG